MRRISLGLLLIAMTTQLVLVRVFDVIWNANMAYMIITMVMFCFGLSGVYLSFRPVLNAIPSTSTTFTTPRAGTACSFCSSMRSSRCPSFWPGLSSPSRSPFIPEG